MRLHFTGLSHIDLPVLYTHTHTQQTHTPVRHFALDFGTFTIHIPFFSVCEAGGTDLNYTPSLYIFFFSYPQDTYLAFVFPFCLPPSTLHH